MTDADVVRRFLRGFRDLESRDEAELALDALVAELDNWKALALQGMREIIAAQNPASGPPENPSYVGPPDSPDRNPASDPLKDALHLLADEAMESGLEIGEAIEERRAQSPAMGRVSVHAGAACVSSVQKPHKWRCWPWKHVWHEAGSEDYWDEHANYRDRPIQRCANCRAWRWTPGG